jgi:hypothetical protein
MPELVLFLDEPAVAAIEGAAAFLAEHHLTITHRTAYSVAFAETAAAGGAAPAGATPLPAGSGQLAAVPVQLRPEWCRLWVTVHDTGRAAAVAAAYVEAQRERSRRVEAAVQALEAAVYAESSWPAYEANLRAALQRQGEAPDAVAARIAAFKRRWQALGRRAAQSPPEDPRPA